MAISKEDIVRVKGRGFLINRGTECFSGRVVPAGTMFSAHDLKMVGECAEKFGSGKVTFTSRQTAEIPGIPFDKIEEAEAFLAKENLYFGGTGAKVRPITACKGTTCVYGNYDTQALALEMHNRFYIGMSDVKLPHKFKIGIGGCPNSCMKPSLNDIGIEGHKVFEFDSEKCRGCKKCAVMNNCPVRAVSAVDGKVVIDEKCLSCGVCVGKCPFGAVPTEVEPLCRIYVGGTWGKTTRIGTPLKRLVPVSQVGDIVESAMLWYRENGYVKERFGVTIDRVGVESLEAALFSGELIARKDEILAAPLKERP